MDKKEIIDRNKIQIASKIIFENPGNIKSSNPLTKVLIVSGISTPCNTVT